MSLLTTHLCCLGAVSVKTTRSAPAPMVRVMAASPAITAHGATAGAHLVTTERTAGKSAHAAETMNPVTQKPGDAGVAILDGRDPGVFLERML